MFSSNSNNLKRFIIITWLLSIVFIFSGCWETTDNSSNTQRISFSDYTINISPEYIAQSKDNLIDTRISDHVLWVYSKIDPINFSDNIIISQDKVSPSISLDDYVQASIGGIEYTWGKYTSLSFKKDTIQCNNTEIPTIINTFSIYRVTPTWEAETLYFVHYYIHRLDEVITISASTKNEDSVSNLKNMIWTTSCNTLQK